MKNTRRLITIGIAGMLAACGGGGGNSPSPTPTPVTPSNTGSVTANFTAGSSAHYILNATGLIDDGALTTASQDVHGVMTTLNHYVFTGSPTVTNEISGDTTYAMGRWRQGSVSSDSGTTQLSGTDNLAYHYLVYNNLATFPTSGSATCDGGQFTAASLTANDGTVDPQNYFATASSIVSSGMTQAPSLTFTASGASASGDLTLSINGTNGYASVGGSFLSRDITPGADVYAGNYQTQGNGMLFSIGDGGNGSYLLAVSYRQRLADYGNYQGIALFHCR